MRRLTATVLLLFAFAGTFVPIATALATRSSSAQPHACCVRKSAHPCHGSDFESEQPVIRDTGCCSHDCCRAVRSSQRAYAQQQVLSLPALGVDGFDHELHPAGPGPQAAAFHSTRAPPAS